MQTHPGSNGQADDNNQPHDPDKGREKNTIQRDMIMVESDYHKFANEKNALDMEIRSLKKDEAQIKIGLHDKMARLSKVEYELSQADAALKSLKKKLNLIH